MALLKDGQRLKPRDDRDVVLDGAPAERDADS